MVDGEEIPVREWEVVSMTESTYAAAPNRNEISGASNSLGKVVPETSNSVFAFGDLVFPPSQHENLPLEPEVVCEQENDDSNDEGDFVGSVDEEGIRSGLDQQNQINIKGYHFPIFDAKGNLLSVGDTELPEHDTMPSPGRLRSAQSESSGSGPIIESSIIDEVTGSCNNQSSDIPKHRENDEEACNLPCGAWWNRKVASLYAQTKAANGFYSICVAATILGLLIIGQHWQQERWQYLQLKWQSTVFDEKIGRMVGPLTRLKDLIIGGNQRRGSLINSNDS